MDWIGIGQSKYFDWKQRYGKVNEHNANVPRDHWLEEDERQDILDYQQKHPLEGYRRLTYMMMDANVVAASPATVYRVLKSAGIVPMEQQANHQRNRFCAATSGARALAR